MPAEHMRRLGELISYRPQRTWVRALGALLVIALGIFVVARPDAVVHVLAIAVGAYAIFLALSELLIMIVPPPAEGETDPVPLRKRIRLGPTLGLLAVVAGIVVVVVLVTGKGEHDGAKKRLARSIERCNGFAELCDKRLNEVAFPSVHNAMSAAEDNFLIANNRKPQPHQLEAGVRGLLIDAHYGIKAKNGTVITDLKREGKTREEIIETACEDFVETAERLIGRVSGTEKNGEPGAYFFRPACPP